MRETPAPDPVSINLSDGNGAASPPRRSPSDRSADLPTTTLAVAASTASGGEGVTSSSRNLLLGQVAGAALALLAEIYVARTVGPSGRGIFAVVLTTMQLGSLLGSFALGVVGVREAKQRRIPQSVVTRAVMLGTVITGSVAGVMSAAGLAGLYPGSISIGLLIGMAAAVLLYSYVVNLRYLWIGFGDSRLTAVNQALEKALVLAALFVCVLLLGETWEAVLWAPLAATVLLFLMSVAGVRRLRRHRHAIEATTSAGATLRRLWRPSAQLLVGNVAQYANYRLDVFFVAAWSGPSAVGLYAVAVSLSWAPWYVADAVARSLFPVACGEATRGTIPHRTLRAAAVGALLTLGVSLIVLPASFVLVPLLFGQAFAQASVLLAVLLPGVMALAMTKMYASVLTSRGLQSRVSYIAGMAAILTVVGNIILVPFLDAMGAAIASTIAYTASGTATMLSVRQETGLGVSVILRYELRASMGRAIRRVKGRVAMRERR